MWIDLTVTPVTISIDLCPGSVVVRTYAGLDVDGLLYTREHERLVHQEPNAILDGKTPKSALYEFRLKRPDITDKKMWEVATVTQDIHSSRLSTWRAYIHVEKHPRNPDLWLIGVGPGEGSYFVRLAVKSLFLLSFNEEPVPLAGQKKKVMTSCIPTAWSRLIDE